MIVLSIMVVLAGSLIVSLDSAHGDTQFQVTANTLLDLRDALLSFRRDTGYLPGEGPFSLSSTNGVKPSAPPGTIGVEFDSDLEWQAWFESPANVLMLIQRPNDPNSAGVYQWTLVGPAAQLARWDSSRGRGWNGPYLSANSVDWVQLLDNLHSDGTFGASIGNTLPPVPAVSDSYLFAPPEADDDPFQWHVEAASPALTSPHGRPLYRFMRIAPSNGRPTMARVVSSGADGLLAEWPTTAVADGESSSYQERFENTDLTVPPTEPTSDDEGVWVVR